MIRVVLSLFFLLQSPQHLNLPGLVDKVSDRYGRLNSLSADFEQYSKDLSNRTSQSRGHVSLKSGKRAVFEYPGKIEYFDGKTYTLYVPDQKNATQRPIGKTEDDRLLIFLILGNRESPWKDQFDEKEELPGPQTPGNRVIRLIPNNKNFTDVVVEVDPRTFLIHRFVFTKADGERNEYRFKNIQTAPLDDSLFKFKAPPGVDVFVVK